MNFLDRILGCYTPLPFPSKAIQEKNVEDYMKFLDHIKSLEINIPFLEALAEMPKYSKFRKAIDKPQENGRIIKSSTK